MATSNSKLNPITVEIDGKDLLNKLSKIRSGFTNKNSIGLYMVFETLSKKMESYAKKTARWQDRTGLARKSLNGYANWDSSTLISANLAHGVYYGLYLELSHNRKYAILEESARLHTEDLKQGVIAFLKTLT